MVHFVSISLLLIFVVWLNYEIGKNNRLSNKNRDKFLENESLANRTRKADISDLDYITIPFDKLPLNDNSDQTNNSYRDTILSHSNKKILNLSGISNTELKLKYGVSNINHLIEYDNNFTVLVSTLNKWGERLYMKGFHKDALAVLETALECGTDVHRTFELLAEIYIKLELNNEANNLIHKVSSSNIRDKESLIQKLNGLTYSK